VKEPSEPGEMEPPAPEGGLAGPGQTAESQDVTSTICSGCAEAFTAYRNPVLVVSREWARLFDDLVEMLKDRPEIQVILDRRRPAGEETEESGWQGPERRRKPNPFRLE
jgi:hypothetical protein